MSVSEVSVITDLSAENAEELEREFVRNTYDVIAEHFSHTRYKHWPRVKEFIESCPPFALVADVGCGNGKYLSCTGPNKPVLIGCDNCENFVKICTERKFEAFCASNLQLPYRTSSLDVAISIAVIHHFTTAHRRLDAIRELLRVVRPGGRILIYVWALEQKGRPFSSQDNFVPWHLQRKYREEPTNHGVQNPRNEHEIVYKRFYHVYREGELEEQILSIPGTSIVQSGYDTDNWFVVAEKQVESVH